MTKETMCEKCDGREKVDVSMESDIEALVPCPSCTKPEEKEGRDVVDGECTLNEISDPSEVLIAIIGGALKVAGITQDQYDEIIYTIKSAAPRSIRMAVRDERLRTIEECVRVVEIHDDHPGCNDQCITDIITALNKMKDDKGQVKENDMYDGDTFDISDVILEHQNVGRWKGEMKTERKLKDV